MWSDVQSISCHLLSSICNCSSTIASPFSEPVAITEIQWVLSLSLFFSVSLCRTYVLIRNKVLQLSLHFLLCYFNKLERQKIGEIGVLHYGPPPVCEPSLKHNLNNSISPRWESVACHCWTGQIFMNRLIMDSILSRNNNFRLGIFFSCFQTKHLDWLILDVLVLLEKKLTYNITNKTMNYCH